MGARKRQPVHPLFSNLRMLGTLAVLIAMLGAVVTTSRASAEVDGNAYTGENFDWSIEWDEDVWNFDSEDNSGGSDFFSLVSLDETASSATFLAAEGLPDLEECVNSWAEMILSVSGSRDYEQLDHTSEIEVRPGGAAAVFQYDTRVQNRTISTASYVQCFPMTDDVVFRVTVLTDLRPREATFATVEDILQTLEVSGSDSGTRESTDDGDDDRSRADSDDSTENEGDSGRGTFNSGDNDDTGRDDDTEQDDDANQDDNSGQQDDEDTGRDAADDDRDDNSNRADDEDDRRSDEAVDTGIDGNVYVSPTYDFTVEWNEDVWTAVPDDELIDEYQNELSLDRLVLDTETASLFVEGHFDLTDGDMEACVEAEIEVLEQSDEVSNFEVLENENGDPMVGETVGSAYRAITLTMDDVNLAEYVECRPIDAGESVLVITLITRASNFDDATIDMADVIDSIDV